MKQITISSFKSAIQNKHIATNVPYWNNYLIVVN